MSSLTEAFRVVEAAGYKLVPVFGTKWYEVSGPDGWVVLVKEKDIVEAVRTGEPDQIRERLHKAGLAAKSVSCLCV